MTRITLAVSLALGSALLSVGPAPSVFAQNSSANAADASSYIGVINADDVYVRAGANDSYYAFAKVSRGALVQVMGDKFDWIRVGTVGPAFRNILGYIKYETSGTPRLKLSADGTTAVTLGRVDIYAPNLDAANNPGESWKPIIRLEAEQNLQVVETIKTDRELIHKVMLPAGASGWIHKKFVERADASQIEAWKSSVQEAPTVARPPVPPVIDEKQSTPVKQSAKDTNTPTNDVQTPANTPTETVNPEQPAGNDAMPVNENVPDAAAAEAARAAREAAEAQKKVEALKLPELEAALKQVQKEDPSTAELDPLRNLFLEYADRHADDAKGARYAKARAEQLGVWMEIQKQKAELAEAQNRAKLGSDDALHARKALDASAEYVVVGKLVASTIYDGTRLPKLLRIQDPGSNRTLAYLRIKQDDHDVVSMISQIIGVVGEKTFDEVLQLSIVSPRRIDILSPNEETVTVEASGKQALNTQ